MINYSTAEPQPSAQAQTPHPLDRHRRLVTVDTTPFTQEVARRLYGAPTAIENGGAQWRFNAKGSLAIEVADSPGKKTGEWFDHEQEFGGRDPQSLLIEREGYTPEAARDFLVSCGVRLDEGRKGKASIVATYDYKDEKGQLLFQVCRMSPKAFRQRRPDGNGGWSWSVKGVRLVPYRLPELIAADPAVPVLVVEGEKDADNLAALGFVVTTNARGAGKWNASYNRYLAGRHVILLPDNDEVGRQHMASIAKGLAGMCLSLQTIALPQLPEKGDVSDWLKNGGGRDSLIRICSAGLAEPQGNGLDASGSDTTSVTVIPPQQALNSLPVPVPDWISRLILLESGEPRQNLDNICIAIEHEKLMQGVLGFDEFAQNIMMLRPAFWVPRNGHWDVRGWTDTDTIAFERYLQQCGLQCVKANVHDAITLIAQKNKFHPVRDYLESLVWDRKPRLDAWLTYYLGAEDSPYHRKAGAAWLISGVARIMIPGCKADCMLFLVGAQGALKSSVFRVLAGEWFSDYLPDFTSKDSGIALQGIWVMELADLEQFSRADVRAIKAFMSRTNDRFRPPFAITAQDHKRQVIFGGSTNEDEFLKDATGDRRFWPVRIGEIDLDALVRDRDQLWAEARHRFGLGEPWHLVDPEIVAQAKEVQAEHHEGDVWDGLLDMHLAHSIVRRTSIIELLREPLGIPRDRWDRVAQLRVARYLKRHGWVRKRERWGWIYVRGEENAS